jgi:hypothetical protein
MYVIAHIICNHPQFHVFLTSLLDGGEFHAPAALPSGKKPLVPIGRLDGPQSRSGRGGEVRIFNILNGNPSIPILSHDFP